MERETTSLVDIISELRSRGASELDLKRAFNRNLEMRARKNRVPLHGKFELTPFCNLDCKMCYVHLNGAQYDKASLLPADTWKALIGEAHRAGMLYATLTGGECLTYPGFDAIYLFCRDHGIFPAVMTNGLLLDRERIDFFSKYPPSLIQVTFYGSSDDAYEKVTGARVFQTVYSNLERARASGLRVTMVLTPSSYMADDIRPLLETAVSLRLPFGINANLITPRRNTGRQLEDLEVDQYIGIYRIWKELKQETLSPIDPVELPDESRDGSEARGLQCGGGRSSFAVQYNGKMSPCPSLSEVTTEPLAEGFRNAWHRLNLLADGVPMPCECTSCAYRECCLVCPAIHGNAQIPGHCDRRICERTKRLVREGFIPLADIVKG